MIKKVSIFSTFLAVSLLTTTANACEYSGEEGTPDIEIITERLSDNYGDLPELSTLRSVDTPKGEANSLHFFAYENDSDREIVLIRKVSESLVQAHLQHSVQVFTAPDVNGSFQGYVLGAGIYEYDILIGEPCSAVISSVKLVQELGSSPAWNLVPKSFSMFQPLLLSEEEWCAKFGVCS